MADEKQTPPPEELPPDHGTPPADPPPDTPAAPDPEPDPDRPGEPGPLTDDAKALFGAVRDGIAAYVIGLRALKRLFVAEAVLARDATVLGLVFLLLSMIGFGTAFALLTGLVVYLLIWSGLPIVLSLFLPLVVCGFLGWFTMRRARAAFRYADFAGTLRQFERGLAPTPDDPANPTPERASHPAETNA
jgi:hypothetical protein